MSLTPYEQSMLAIMEKFEVPRSFESIMWEMVHGDFTQRIALYGDTPLEFMHKLKLSGYLDPYRVRKEFLLSEKGKREVASLRREQKEQKTEMA